MESGRELTSTIELDGRVLIVEDEVGVCKLLTRLLGRTNASIEVAKTGRQGLNLFSQHSDYSLAILDLSLPDLNGLDVLKEIRVAQPTLPVVLSSGHDEAKFESVLSQDNNLHYLSKPYHLQKFWNVLTTALCSE